MKLAVYSEESFTMNKDRKSHVWYPIFVVDKYNKGNVIGYYVNKSIKVVR